MARGNEWFRVQSEDELMSEAKAKELKKKRNGLRHAFKDDINKKTAEGKSLTMEEKFAIFKPYYEQMEISPAEMARYAFVQELQKAMQVHGRDEKAQDERDIYTDRKTGVVGNIRLSRDPYFVKNLQQRFEHRADKYIQKSRICGDSLKRIQRDMPKEYSMFEQGETGTGTGR